MKVRLFFLGAVFLAALSAGSAAATEPAPETVTFRFLSDSDGFFLVVGENRALFSELLDLVDRYRTQIGSGEVPVYVTGYCDGLETPEANLASARIRSNRVKSELIVRKGLTEAHFVTQNHASPYGDEPSVVIVALNLPGNAAQEAPKREKPPLARPHLMDQPVSPEPEPEPEPESEPEPITQPEPPHRRPESRPVEVLDITDDTGYSIHGIVPANYRFAIRTNLLHWAMLMPDLGFEWRMGCSFGLLTHGAWTHWNWKNGARKYHLWEIAPEFRWYLGLSKQWHLGLQYQIGRYNIMLSDEGRRGRFQGGSLVGGYQFLLGRRMILDLTLGVGGTRFDYTKYERQNGVNIPIEEKTRTWWGPNQAAVTLGWRIGKR